ncbi:MAG: transcriptional regulator [Deltaproteobacteria bacterium CG_4_8_14_3_um_filter_51_11]|nr:MAG: transcriptional regulator [Deltaproteobacteria bacterium CG17_big_fil_post_rev_8_21_14_2_50_51_6]PIX20872.1 MAG: transcriptional regulator [Deltaproteobacteria bacterium CG_4_8_14_3_um_filter_51_11]
MSNEKVIRLLERERFELSGKSGGGTLQYEAWGYQEKERTVVTRYNIAYINHKISPVDNGRVLGYDNAHGYHHRHWMDSIEPFEFESYASVVDRFQAEWKSLMKRRKEERP